jgi:cell division protein FtsW
VFRPVSTEFALIASTSLLLTVFGLVMILSASSANAVENGRPVRDRHDQALVAAIGIPLMFLMSRFPSRSGSARPGRPDRRGRPQMLVYTPLGVENDGNTNWLRIGGQVVQPSEFIKLALALWAGFVLWRKQSLLGVWKHVFIP